LKTKCKNLRVKKKEKNKRKDHHHYTKIYLLHAPLKDERIVERIQISPLVFAHSTTSPE
jgi:hypothetical protein